MKIFGWTIGKERRREIIINSENLETRVAMLDSNRLEEYQVEHPTQERMVGSIYKGRIQNLEHDLQAAFVDIGMRRNAFLHYWDMIPDDDYLLDMEEEPARQRMPRRKRFTNEEITRHFPPGSEIVVQVTKGPIGNKGPRVTASLSLPGRYLVMVPGSKMKGISRKIADEKERQRLKSILGRITMPHNAGLIVRTAGQDARKGNFFDDVTDLTAKWDALQQAMREKSAPSCLYQEPDLLERVIRDWLTDDVDRVIIDSPEGYERIRELAARISRSVKARIQLYEGDLPIFEHYDVERQIEATFGRQVELKSGGCIVIDETEAMVAIDVNTGKFKGKGSQEDAIYEVNLEAVDEVARQLRLRNIGGLIVIDLIDMKSRKHQSAVFRAMKEAMKKDKARVNVLPISELGIMEMSRQRMEESLLSAQYVDCPYCGGRGLVKSPLGISVDVQRHIQAVLRRSRKSQEPLDLQVVVHPTILERLRREDEQLLIDLETKHGGRLSFKSDPSRHVESFLIRNAKTDDILYTSDK
jgi:ribonuclease G